MQAPKNEKCEVFLMEIGVVITLNANGMEEKFRKAAEGGFGVSQLIAWDMSLLTEETAKSIRELCQKYAVRISTFWCGWTGGGIWDFIRGPSTLGIVPPETQAARVAELQHGSDFARMIGADRMATHLGFIPEVPSDPKYQPTVEAVRAIAARCKANGQEFIFETGQETPVTLLRLITDTGCDNLGINLDPANLILYGKANPVDALCVFGQYVRDVHAKDGRYPTNGRQLGVQTPLGEGQVDFPALIAGLRRVGYDGTLIIEREISGPEQERDILAAKAMLEALI